MVGKEQWAVSDLGTLCTAILNLVLNLNGLSTTYIGGFPHSDLLSFFLLWSELAPSVWGDVYQIF